MSFVSTQQPLTNLKKTTLSIGKNCTSVANTHWLKLTTIVTLLMLLMSLYGCSSQTKRPNLTLEEPAKLLETSSDVQQLLAAAQAAASPKRQSYLLDAMELLLAEKKDTEAAKVHAYIDPNPLANYPLANYPLANYPLANYPLANYPALNYRYYKTTGRLYLAQGKLREANLALNQAQMLLKSPIQVSETERTDFYELVAHLLQVQGRFLASARLSIFNQPKHQLTDEVIQAHERIWSRLVRVPGIELEQIMAAKTEQAAAHLELNAWLDLAFLMHFGNQNIVERIQLLKDWEKRWQNTKVAQYPPKSIRRLLEAQLKRYQQIAVLLPTDGPYKQAASQVLKGLLASYYQDTKNQDTNTANPKLRIYDTSTGAPILSVYQQAIADGADLVIGPLQKKHVTSLMQTPSLAVPLIALNYANKEPAQGDTNNDKALNTESAGDTLTSTHTSQDSASHLAQNPSNKKHIQFGLSIEDEAQQIAHTTRGLGYQRALVLFPDSDWGYRVAQAFSNSWKELDGTLVLQQSFSKPKYFSREVKKALGIGDSERRKRALSSFLNKRLEFLPRRRQDIDMIFLAASPKTARQLKPTLNFHYAENIPVFSTSHLYQGFANPKANKDLENIYFLDIPWVLSTEHTLKAAVGLDSPDQRSALTRLQALGVDAYQLSLYHGLIMELDTLSFPGATGMLHIDKTRRVTRTLTWARFNRGIAKPVILNKHDQTP